MTIAISRTRRMALVIGTLVILAGMVLAYEVVATAPVRQAVRAYSELISVGNRPDLSDAQRLASAGQLCSARFLAEHKLALGPEGGIAGLPRTMNKNFQAWRQGENVWLCPTNRIGPVYQFVRENGQWRFDGLVALLRPRGELIPAKDLSDLLQQD
jgi:hypothetical protein